MEDEGNVEEQCLLNYLKRKEVNSHREFDDFVKEKGETRTDY